MCIRDRVEAAPAYNSEAICQYHGKYSDAACYDSILSVSYTHLDVYKRQSFDRPGIKQILDDAKSGQINLIRCKDLSRFGRNYIEVGQYIDYIFPSFNIRFIALSDNVDKMCIRDRNMVLAIV